MRSREMIGNPTKLEQWRGMKTGYSIPGQSHEMKNAY